MEFFSIKSHKTAYFSQAISVFHYPGLLLFHFYQNQKKQMEHFLTRLTDICLQQYEKENQILSQKENKRRFSKTGQTATPFAQQFIARKSRKKITFQDEAETLPASILAKSTKKTSEKVALILKAKRSSQFSTNQTTLKTSHPHIATPIVFPIDYHAKLKIIRSLR